MSTFVIVRSIYLALMLGLLLLAYFLVSVSWWYFAVPTALFLLLIVLGSANMQMNYFTRAYTQLPGNDKTIALTFDDGPSAAYTPTVLDLLDEYEAKATFFCIGHRLENEPELAREIIRRGHIIGNHSYSHSYYFSIFNSRKVADEIRQTNELIEQLSGQPCRLFRPPYGVTNPSIAKAIKACGMLTIGWNIRSFDTSSPEPQKVVRRVIKRIKPGSVILLHDDRKNTPEILEGILQYSRERNYTFALAHKMLT